MFRRLTKDDCKITISAELDDIPIRGNAIASGDDNYDKELEDDLIRRVNDGDIWAWAFVKVTAECEGITGVDTLGGCSYESEDDFIKSGDYYNSMVDTAVNNLNDKLAKVYKSINQLTENIDPVQ